MANIVYKSVPLGRIFADEFFNPSSVIYSEACLMYLFAEVMSDIFSHGIVPLAQNRGLCLSGVPPALILAISLSLHHTQLSGISNGKSSVISLTCEPTFS